MKLIAIAFSVLCWGGGVWAQDTLSPTRPVAVRSQPLYITSHFTTNLVFPYGIGPVDIGSPDVLAKKSGPWENVLLLKAGVRGFSPTNLSVYTKDGRLYSYLLFYADTLSVYNYSYTATDDWHAKAFLHRKVKADGMKIRLTGIYCKQGMLWLLFDVRNHSPIDYYPGVVHFTIADHKRTRKKVVQEESWEPVYAAQTNVFASASGNRLRYGFAARTPDKGKEVIAEWADQNGERRVRMVIPGKELLKARGLEGF